MENSWLVSIFPGEYRPAERDNALDGGLLDAVVFAVGVGGHGFSRGVIADKYNDFDGNGCAAG